MNIRRIISPHRLVRAVLWLLVYAFLLSYLHPELILKDSVITGGDTASHYFTAVYLKEHLLPQARIMGWLPANYAGFPLFQFYFPLPFLVIVGLSLAMPLTVAFKIVTVSGVLCLPLGAYSFLKNMGYKKPIPDLGGVFSLAFLFIESNSAWGGNLPSNLAGEFAYGIGLTLALIYLGRLYRDMDRGGRVIGNALILALAGLSHGYPLLFCVLGASFFLITTRDWISRLAYILKVNILAFCFMGFWIVPLLLFSPYTTAFNFVWLIDGWSLVLPVILWPFVIMGLAGAAFSLFSRAEVPENRTRVFFLGYLILIAAVYYFIAPKIGGVDIRFLPFGQILLVILGAVAAGRVLGRLQAKSLAALALALGTVIWVAHNETYIEKWVEWNYSGYEGKRLWPAFKRVNDYLRGGFDDPRVAYEHAAQTKGVGTLRAFESLPLFSGRATLEGLYIQSSLSSPFVFYLQSEISQIFSSPLFKYNYSRFDLERGRRHMELFNVGQYVSVTGRTKSAAERTPGFKLEKSFPPFAVFSLPQNSGRYVVQPNFKPVLALSRDPKRDGFAWFRLGDLDVPVVFSLKAGQEERRLFAEIIEPNDLPRRLRRLPRQELPRPRDIRETVKDSEIIIEGATPGRPLWIRVSYHPNWLVEGADRVWRASPAFMLVFPTQQQVRLYFGRTRPDYLGLALTFLGILYAVWFRARSASSSRLQPADFAAIMTRALEPLARLVRPRARLVLIGVVSLAGLGALFLILAVGYQDPQVIHNRGLRLFTAKEYDRAAIAFDEGLRKFPLSLVVDQTLNHLALCYFHREMYEQARTTWRRFETDYPESRLMPEVLYHIGLCDLRQNRVRKASEVWVDLTARFPTDRWAKEAAARLAEIKNKGPEEGPAPLSGRRKGNKGP